MARRTHARRAKAAKALADMGGTYDPQSEKWRLPKSKRPEVEAVLAKFGLLKGGGRHGSRRA